MRYHICSGEIVHTYSVDGSVISQAPEVYVDEIIVEGISDKNFDMLKKKGDKLSPGDTLFTFKGTDKSVDCNAQIVDVAFETEDRVRRAVIHLLNYDKLFLVVNVSSDKIDKLS